MATRSMVATASTGYLPTADLGRQHHRVGAFEHGGGDVGDLGPGRRRRVDHRFQHLRGDHHRLAGIARRAGDLLLQAGDLLHRHLHAEIAARHHDGVGEIDDLLEMIERRRLLDLGHHRGAAARELARLGDVLGALHEGQRDPGDAERQGELDVGAVLLGHGAERQHGVGQADALAAAEHAARHHLGIDADVACLDDAQLELAVVEQQRVAGLHGLEDFGMRQVHAAQAADRFAADEAQHVAFGRA